MLVSFMRRFLTMLAFAAWTIPAAGCTAMRTVGTLPGPVECDPPERASPHLALGSLEGFEAYSTASLTGAEAAPAGWRGAAASRGAEAASENSSIGQALVIAG
jgi:hypothetical protein